MIKSFITKKMFNKNTLLMSVFLGLSVSTANVFAGDQSITCPNVEYYDQKFIFEDTPFYGVDEKKILDQLPASTVKEIAQIEERLDELLDEMGLEQAFSSDTSDPLVVELYALEERMDQLLDGVNIEFVESNLLDSLNEEQRAEAISLWCDLAFEMDQHDQQLDDSYAQLDKILHRL